MKLKLIPALVLALVGFGCSTITKFDQNSLTAATRIKYEAVTLIAHGTEAATLHTQEIATLRSDLNGQIAYEEGKGKPNTITLAQWKVIASPDGNLVGGFLKKWEAGTKFNPAYVKEQAILVGQGIDVLIRLESAKIR